MTRRSESGHGLTGAAVLLFLLLVFGPPVLGAVGGAVAAVRLHHPWWVAVLAGLGGAVAGYVVAWGAGLLVGALR